MEFLSEIIHRDKFIIEQGSHTRDAIIIVLSGKFSCTVGGQEILAQVGDICVFHANTQFQRHVLEPIRCVYLQFEPFPMELPAGLLPSADPVRTENTIAHLADAVEEENGELTEHFVRDLLLLSRRSERGFSDPIVSGCIRIFRREFSRQLSLDELAARFSISKQGLIAKFRRVTGKTPMEHLSTVRINHGKQLLRDTALPISEVAASCGFDNIYYFSNWFKRVTGVRPSQYRKLNDL